MKKIYLPLIIIIFFIGCFVRFYQLGIIPQVLTRDDAAIGYNAYSILKTGRDEYGVRFPLSFLSFGDYKNPLYIYLTSGIIPFLGLTEFSVRFWSALSGSLTVLATFFLLRELLKKTKEEMKNFIAFMAAFLLAIAPWQIFYSRIAYEATVALFLVILGLIFLLKARTNINYLIPSLIVFILSFFTYNPPIFILPVLIPVTVLLFKEEYLKKSKVFIISFLAFFYLSLFVYFLLSRSLISGRTDATIFSQKYLEAQINLKKIEIVRKSIYLKLITYQKPFIVYKLVTNYFSVLKPEFLFFGGDGHLWHGISLTGKKIGNQYLLTLPFFILGLIVVIRQRKKETMFILFWLLISPIACGITQDAPNTTRLHDFLYTYLLVTSIGIHYLYVFLKQFRFIFLTIILAVFINNLIGYLKVYLTFYPKAICRQEYSFMWPCGIKQVINYVRLNENKYKEIFIVTPTEENEEPYIQFAFYLKTNPLAFQKNAFRKTKGFLTVKKFDNYYFEDLPFVIKISEIKEVKKINSYYNKPGRLIISREINSLIQNVPLKEINKITDDNGKTLWLFLKT